MRYRRSALLGLLGLLVALPAGGGPANAAGREPGPLERAGASVSLVGNGYGHGHGLSQHGAQSRAAAGHTYRQILRFYYPGLRWGEATGLIRVRIDADTTNDVVVRARSGLRVGTAGSGTTYPLSRSGVAWWRLVAADGGRLTRVEARTRDGAWRFARTLRGQAQVSAGGGPITLRTPSGDVAYRGVLRSAAPNPARPARDTVNVLPLDSYLRGVVPREVPASWAAHAVRAQSVAARTYAASDRAHARSRYYHTCDTTSCQVYGGYSAEHPDSNAAIGATAGEVLLADGEPAFTQFSASNGGWTAEGSKTYLPAKQDSFDRAYRHWTDTVTAREIQRAFPAIGTFQRVAVLSRDGNGEWNGRVLRIRIVGSRASTTITGDDFRSFFGLRSNWFRQA
jgi:SpoIID/LytB domain protein